MIITLDRSDGGPGLLRTSNFQILAGILFMDQMRYCSYAHAEFICSLIFTEGARMQDYDSAADEVSLHERL